MSLFYQDSLGAKLVDVLNSLPSADDDLVDDAEAPQAAQQTANAGSPKNSTTSVLRTPRPPVPFPIAQDTAPWPPEHAGSIGLRILAWALVLLAVSVAIPTFISLLGRLIP